MYIETEHTFRNDILEKCPMFSFVVTLFYFVQSVKVNLPKKTGDGLEMISL